MSVELYTLTTNGGTGFVSGSLCLDNTYLGLIDVDDPDEDDNTGSGDNNGNDDNTGGGNIDGGDNIGSGNSPETYNGKSVDDLSSFITVAKSGKYRIHGVATDGGAIDGDFFYVDARGFANGREDAVYSFRNLTALTENYVFETNLKLYNVSTGRDITFMLTSNPESASALSIYGMGFCITFGTGNNKGYLVLKALGGTKEYNLGITSSDDNNSGWINVRYEVDGLSVGSATRLIVNGVVVDSFYSYSDISDTAAMQMILPGTNEEGEGPAGFFEFDNTYCGGKKAEE